MELIGSRLALIRDNDGPQYAGAAVRVDDELRSAGAASAVATVTAEFLTAPVISMRMYC